MRTLVFALSRTASATRASRPCHVKPTYSARHCYLASILCTVLLLTLSTPLLAHDPRLIPPDPTTAAEAWNVIGESVRNVDQLLDTRLLPDIALQVANISPCLRLFDRLAADHPQKDQLRSLSAQLMQLNSEVVLASREKADAIEKTRAVWQRYRVKVGELQAFYPPAVLKAAVYICPMHPAQRDLNIEGRCPDCGMALVRRRIPASTIYEKPGEPSIKMTVVADPLEVGKKATVRIKLSQAAGGAPVVPRDLVRMHTRKIHLLINDFSLSDYHHEHPEPTETDGEFIFSFTPKNPGSYRIWADLVPVATSIQEYVVADIPAKTQPKPLTDRETRLTSNVNGRKYELVLFNEGKPVRAGQAVVGQITVTGADGKPFTQLEPVMGAFAHIVGFGDDLRTIVHIHPTGREPVQDTERGGPSFNFRLYIPQPGFVRLYGQVQIGQEQQFPPFGLNVLPAEK